MEPQLRISNEGAVVKRVYFKELDTGEKLIRENLDRFINKYILVNYDAYKTDDGRIRIKDFDNSKFFRSKSILDTELNQYLPVEYHRLGVFSDNKTREAYNKQSVADVEHEDIRYEFYLKDRTIDEVYINYLIEPTLKEKAEAYNKLVPVESESQADLVVIVENIGLSVYPDENKLKQRAKEGKLFRQPTTIDLSAYAIDMSSMAIGQSVGMIGGAAVGSLAGSALGGAAAGMRMGVYGGLLVGLFSSRRGSTTIAGYAVTVVDKTTNEVNQTVVFKAAPTGGLIGEKTAAYFTNKVTNTIIYEILGGEEL
jgi:hypothetical protein